MNKKDYYGDIRSSRFDSLSDTIDYYIGLYDERGDLSVEQADDLYDTAKVISSFGEAGEMYYNEAMEVLEEIGYISTNVENVKSILRTCNGYDTIGEKLERKGFKVHYNGRTICNFSLGDTYYYASNHNTPFWELDDVKIFKK